MSNNEATKTTNQSGNILEVSHLKKYFPIKGGFFGGATGSVKAVDDVSFNIKRGTTMGLVGESGCGKSTTGRTILRLIEKTDGEILFNGEDISKYDKKQLRDLRTKMQIIFQDPYSSLSPRLPIGEIIGEAVREHGLVPKEQFDEPVSALDVSIQAQIINLLRDLQKERGLTYLFISHDLSVVEHISDTVGVMYLGGMVESGETADIFGNPLHPYTKALFSAIPMPDPDVRKERILLKGDIPSPANPPAGCKFHTRCSECMEICKHEEPQVKDVGNGHKVKCHLYDEK